MLKPFTGCPEIPLRHHVDWSTRLMEEGIEEPDGKRGKILHQHFNKIREQQSSKSMRHKALIWFLASVLATKSTLMSIRW